MAEGPKYLSSSPSHRAVFGALLHLRRSFLFLSRHCHRPRRFDQLYLKAMVEQRARCCLCSGAAAVTLLAFLVVYCCFFAAAVNVTVADRDGGFSQESINGSNAPHQDWLREDRMDALDVETLRGRCFVLQGEEQTRCHPNIFFFGVSKCGTTSMVKWMTKHPQMRWVSRVKTTGLLIKPGQEARALLLNKYKTKDEFADKYPFTAPEAAETDPVVDCECGRLRFGVRV